MEGSRSMARSGCSGQSRSNRMVSISGSHEIFRAQQRFFHGQLSGGKPRRVLEQLRAEGVEIDDHIEEYEYGRFAWIMDPEGIELWEPLVPFAVENP